VTLTTPFLGTAQKYFLWDVKGKLCSKLGQDRSKTQLTILAVVEDRQTPDGHAKVNLYSVQCYTLHWTDKNYLYKKEKFRQGSEIKDGINARD